MALAALGILLATLPHLAWSTAATAASPERSFAYLADRDQLYYMTWSRSALLHGTPSLIDAVHHPTGPTMHPWLLFVPQAWLGHALGLSPDSLPILWRILTGAGVALGLYACLRLGRLSPIWAGLVALGLLFDPGFAYGQPLYRELVMGIDLVNGRSAFLSGPPQAFPHLRVVPPGLGMAVWLIHLGCLARVGQGWRSGRGQSRESESDRDGGDGGDGDGGRERGAAWVAAVSLGALFHLYFYFWTTAAATLIALVATDRARRRVWGLILASGLLIGGPAVLANARLKADSPPDWLRRTEKFVPVDRLEDWFSPPRVLLGLWVVGGWWAWKRERAARPWWWAATIGLVGVNQQMITGLQIENFHWLPAAGVPVSLVVASAAGRGLASRSWVVRRPVLAGFLMVLVMTPHVALGLATRWWEARRAESTRHWMAARAQILADTRDWRLPPGSVVAGPSDLTAVLTAYTDVNSLADRIADFSAWVTNQELEHRRMLNLYLLGVSRQQALIIANDPQGFAEWDAYDIRPEDWPPRQAYRIEALDSIWSDPTSWLERFDVDWLILPRGSAPPTLPRSACRLEQSQALWDLWRLP